ncbi:MAG TPA: ABC transporter permease [Candidatus Baltobacteraceae bacterium]|nr:ABC transporter permease [Candidatus Baltobacteraceae bacterium]
MKQLFILRAHVFAMLLDLLRTPAVVVFSLIFPVMFFTIMALPYAKAGPEAANFILCSYIAFAMVGVTLSQFGVGIAAERGRPWERYLRALPVTIGTRFTARIIVALCFGAGAAGLVALAARFFTPLSLTNAQWLLLWAYAIVGAVPFVVIGIALAYWVAPRAALPLTNIVYLLCSFAGGFWIPPQYLPSLAAAVSPFTPTRQYGELLWSIVAPHNALHALAMLGYYTLAFGIIAAIGYRRDERTRYA